MMKIDFENPASRLPVAIVADTSSSMGWGKVKAIDLLNRGLKRFQQGVEEDEIAMMSVETSIVNCGARIEAITNFENIYDLEIPELTAYGGTPLGESVLLALSQLEKRKEQYKGSGIQYYQPMLVIMTDGYATTDTTEAIREINKIHEKNKLSIVCVAIGEDADIRGLSMFSPERKVVTIDKLEFDDFFRWLSESVRSVSTNNGSYGSMEDYNQWKKI